MSAEGWISLGLSGLLSIVTLLIAPEWIKSAAALNPWAMVAWTASFASWFFFIGHGIGMRAKGNGDGISKDIESSDYGLSKRQRSLLSHIASDSGEKLEIDSDILYLVDHELITEEHGYDVDARCLPKRFVITAKGERMLRFHPMWRKVK